VTVQNLQEFVRALEEAGELIRLRRPISAVREITEIADRCMKSPGGGPALLVEQPTLANGSTSALPAGINLFGSMRRMSMALGVEDLDAIGDRITELLTLKVPEGWREKVALLPKLAEITRFPPRTVSGKPPCQEVVLRGEEVDVERLPNLTCWPEDGGAYITLPQVITRLPQVITRDPRSGVRNVGMYRIQVLGRDLLAMHWQRHKVFAGFLRRKPVALARAVTSELKVPAEAEVVIEGYIDPAEPLVLEGPFGDHTGFYSLADHYPAVHVTAITMRSGAIYPCTIVGQPPMEDFYLGHATERIFLPLLRLTVPEIVDYHMPAPGIFHNLVFVSIDKQYPGQAWKVMNALWGMGLMSLAKVIVVLDKGVDVRDPDEAWWVALNHIDPQRDIRFTMGPVDVLDHASRAFTYGSKMGVDATTKWKEEGFDREWPSRIVMDDETKARVDAMWDDLGIPLTPRVTR
jgi:4-hydroxy-3-polyprenylbenzoate decarboxylase